MIPSAAADSPTADREFRHARVIPAAREEVFLAIAEPHRLAGWWGPNGFRSTFEVHEFRPGGAWNFMLHGPDGSDYPNQNAFREIVAPERVVVEHFDDTHHFLLTITLTDVGGQTQVGWHQLFDSAEHAGEVAPFVVPANEQNLERLERETLHPTSPTR